MDDKQQLIKDLLECVRRIIDKHIHIDEKPLAFDADVTLSPREIRTVELLGRGVATNVSEVAAHFHFTKSAASQLVSRLVKRGFVFKETSPHSNKELLLSLTPQGHKAHQIYAEMMREHRNELYKRLGAFSLHQVSTAAVLLEVVENIVDERLKRFE